MTNAPELLELFENNRRWAAERVAADPDFFQRLVHQQNPPYLWIGCSDSRIPANQVIGLDPGMVFVHRNVANQVLHGDLNCLSVLQYAVEFLGVRDIIVCGHYGCGGVRAAMEPRSLGVCDHWLRHIRDVYHANESELRALEDPARYDRLVELNVEEQVRKVSQTSVAQRAWVAGRTLRVHGWVYGLGDGLVRDLGCTVRSSAEVSEAYRMEFPPRSM